jgi:hypothetical protein
MSKQMQWTKFWWGDWARDACLRTSSYAAKGLWMDMLCHMDASDERGFLVISGKAATAADIARIVGGERRTVERLLIELETNGVFSRDDRGAIFSRRMTRDDVISRRNAANGKLGGNPILLENKELEEISVNLPLKADKEEDKIREERKEERAVLRTDAAVASSGVEPELFPVSVKPITARSRLWSDGLPIIAQATGKPPGGCRSLMVMWLKRTKDDCQRLLNILRDAETFQPIEFVSWVTAAVDSRMTKLSNAEQILRELGIEGSISDPDWLTPSADVVPFPTERRLA